MTLDWYACTKCHNNIELEEGKHEFDPPCPKCGGKTHYMSSSDTVSDVDLTRIRSHKDSEKINYDIEEAKRKAKQLEEEIEARIRMRNLPKCPTCGSTDIEHIGTLNRMFSIGFFGLASGKIGKQFKCRNCKYMW